MTIIDVKNLISEEYPELIGFINRDAIAEEAIQSVQCQFIDDEKHSKKIISQYLRDKIGRDVPKEDLLYDDERIAVGEETWEELYELPEYRG